MKKSSINFIILFFLLTCSAILGSAGSAAFADSCIQPPSGMIGWWPGDGNANDIVGSNNGSLQGGATFAQGQVGNAFKLDGIDDYINVPHSSNLDFGVNDFTVDFWVKFNTISGEQILIEKYVEGTPRTGWTLTKLSNNNIRVHLADIYPQWTWNVLDVTPPSIPVDTWIFVTLKRSGDTFTIYWNGIALGSKTFPYTINLNTPASLKIGHRGNPQDTPGSWDTRGFYLNGFIDEVEIFNRALSEVEIKAIFNARSAGKCKPDSCIQPLFTYKADVLPSSDGWSIGDYPNYESTGAQIENGVLHIKDYSLDYGSAIWYKRGWEVVPEYLNVAEFDIKGKSCTECGDISQGKWSLFFSTSDGSHHMIYIVYPDKISSVSLNASRDSVAGQEYYFDTTLAFNTYKAVINGDRALLYINGKLVMDQAAGIGIFTVKGIDFGAGSSAAYGEAYIDEIRAYRACPEKVACVQPPSGMIGWWTGDSNADDIIGSHNGVTQGNVTYSGGKVGDAFNFNGQSYVSVPDNDIWTLGNDPFTIDLWVKFNSFTGRDPFVGHDESGGDWNKWIFWYDTAYPGHKKGCRVPALAFHINSPVMGAIDPICAPWQPVTGKWYHVAVTRSGSTYSLYLDGVLVKTAEDSNTIPNPNFPLTIGRAEGFFLNGQIDELEIFKRALTADEIKAIYNAGSAGKCKSKPSFVNVRLIDTIPTQDVTFVLSSATKAPYSVTELTDKTIVEWRYDSFEIGQSETISFDLDLYKLVPGEERLVDHKLEVIYTDLTGKEVRYELPPLYVSVLSSAYEKSITTDKSVYAASGQTLISAGITNLAEYSKTVDVKIVIEDGQGTLVTEIATMNALNLAAGEKKTFSDLVFNAGTSYAGNYRAHLTLFENKKQVGEAFASFTIAPINAATPKVVTDKASYNSNSQVTITSTVTSASTNYIFKNLTAKITLTNNQGQVLFTEGKSILTLTPGQLTELKTYWNTVSNSQGIYKVTLEVFEGVMLLGTSQATFEIISSSQTGEGLIGTITASPNPVYQGKDETITYSVTDKGNENIAGLNVKVLIVDPNTQEVKATITNQPAAINIGETITGAQTASTLTLTPKVYLAILQAYSAQITEPKTLASATFEVKPGIEVTKTIPDIKNILVWLNYQCVTDSSQTADSSRKDCLNRTLIEQALNEAGVNYFIVTDKKDFEKELRNTFYTDCLILGDHNPIEDHFSEELREQIYSGKGLISSMFNRQNLDEDAFGIKFTGNLSGSDYQVELIGSELSTAGTFQSYGRALRVDALDSSSVAGWIVESSNKGTNKYPGIIKKRQYGNGKILFFAYDLGMSIQNYNQFAYILKNSLNYVHKPMDASSFMPNSLIPVEISVKSLGGAFDVKITETYASELKLYDTATGKWITDNPWAMGISLSPNETKTILYYVLMPDKTGTYILQSEIGYIDNGIYNFYRTVNVAVAVSKTTSSLSSDIISDLNGLSVSGQEKAKVNNAIGYIQSVQNRPTLTVSDIDTNIDDTRKAINSLLFVSSVDVSKIRLMMDELLRILESRYYTAN